jgi:hypothetical protein
MPWLARSGFGLSPTTATRRMEARILLDLMVVHASGLPGKWACSCIFARTLSGAWTGLEPAESAAGAADPRQCTGPGCSCPEDPLAGAAAWTAAARCSVRGLLAVIAVGCDGRRAEAVRQQLGRRSLLAHAVQQVAEAGPDRSWSRCRTAYLAAGVRLRGRQPGAAGRRRHPRGGPPAGPGPCRRQGQPPAGARSAAAPAPAGPPGPGPGPGGARAGRLRVQLPPRVGPALAPLADGTGAVLRSGAPPDLGAEAEDLPWLREDGGFYLLDAATFASPAAAMAAAWSRWRPNPRKRWSPTAGSGLAVCRALLAERLRRAASAGRAGRPLRLPACRATVL